MSLTDTTCCSWHAGDEPWGYDDELTPPYCCNCGRILATRRCDGCGKEYLDWGGEGWDDVMAAPRCSSSGDPCCSGCIDELDERWFDCDWDRIDGDLDEEEWEDEES